MTSDLVLPIDAVISDIQETLAQQNCLVLQAPPGAGKTTRVPLALLDEPWLEGRGIVMLEPRRLAARMAARRMAKTLEEPVGKTVGYRVRFEACVSRQTRVEVVTDGLFLKRIQADPGLEDIGLVIFDEFHERSLDIDVALALSREVQVLRPDLRLLVMSATLDAAPVANLLQGAPILTSEGKIFPVDTRYLPVASDHPLEKLVVVHVQKALREEQGSILVFLPGQGEIRRVEEALKSHLDGSTIVSPLYGDLPPEAQDIAISPPPPGRRKIVLATAIAETSLTIEGVRIVIDSGRMRIPRFDSDSGLTRLETVPVSQAAADQRRGRAGRVEPGICYRLWTEASHRILPRFTPPEIRTADLAPLRLEMACWGVTDIASMAWLDPPSPGALASAETLLRELGALDKAGAVTPHGRAIQGLGLHPRLAHMILTSQFLGLGETARAVAVLVAERDVLRPLTPLRSSDIHARVSVLQNGSAGSLEKDFTVDRSTLNHARKALHQLRSIPLNASVTGPLPSFDTPEGVVVALAYPDRVAQRRPGTVGQFLLASGRGASLPAVDPLASSDFLAVAHLEGGGREGRIHLAAPLSKADLESVFKTAIRCEETIEWDAATKSVKSRRRRSYEALVLSDEPLAHSDSQKIARVFIEGLRSAGVRHLPWTEDDLSFRRRVEFLRRVNPTLDLPDVSDHALEECLEEWLPPETLEGMTHIDHLRRVDLTHHLKTLFSWPMLNALDREAPPSLTVPSGSNIRLDYSGEQPVLAVRLQEIFGWIDTPRVGGDRTPVLLHLLSPAHRPVQVTADLASFWKNTYADVRKDLKGRYPRHSWPDDPMTALPTRRAKPRG